MACVLLDIDGTLFEKPSTEALFIRYLLHRGHVGPRQAMAATGFVLRWLPRYGYHVARKNKAYLNGLDVGVVSQLADQFVAQHLEHRFRETLLQRLRLHREKGDLIALLSGTPAFIAEPIARRVGAQAWWATECAQRGGRFTADPPTRHPLGPTKITGGHALCRALGARLDECVAYADAVHDIPLLTAVGEAVAVHPDRGLARTARLRGWEIIGAPTPVPRRTVRG